MKKKEHIQPIVNRYSFPCTDEMKLQLDRIRDVDDFEVNDAFRRFAAQLIEKYGQHRETEISA